ncbi:MAG: metalloregulator ArsR/SmtB family transcription factor, partial [Candidatus Margulisiibacteriota bacterium]
FPKALHDETRRKIISLLLNTEVNVSRIAEEVFLDSSTVSYHLLILREAGLVQKAGRVGKEMYYTTNKDILQKCVDEFIQDYSNMYGLLGSSEKEKHLKNNITISNK